MKAVRRPTFVETSAREKGRQAMERARTFSDDPRLSGFLRGMAFRWFALAEWCRLGETHRVYQ